MMSTLAEIEADCGGIAAGTEKKAASVPGIARDWQTARELGPADLAEFGRSDCRKIRSHGSSVWSGQTYSTQTVALLVCLVAACRTAIPTGSYGLVSSSLSKSGTVSHGRRLSYSSRRRRERANFSTDCDLLILTPSNSRPSRFCNSGGKSS